MKYFIYSFYFKLISAATSFGWVLPLFNYCFGAASALCLIVWCTKQACGSCIENCGGHDDTSLASASLSTFIALVRMLFNGMCGNHSPAITGE